MSKIFVAGHNGMVGASIQRRLQESSSNSLVARSRAQLDLTDQAAVLEFFNSEQIDQVYLAAAKVGGIHANNTYPAEFIYQNLAIQNNVIDAAFKAGVGKLLFLGSSCIYPRLAEQPMTESALLSGGLEPTNEPYAIAKIAGIKLCEAYRRQYGVDYRSVMPTNLYGQGDNFHPENSHVIPAMMRRFHLAKDAGDERVEVWGSGRPMREFLYVEDMADACVYLMTLSAEKFVEGMNGASHVNIGTGQDCTIAELAQAMARVVGFEGEVVFDKTKPDGTPRKLLDVSLLSGLGWHASTTLDAGLRATYEWFLEHELELRGAA